MFKSITAFVGLGILLGVSLTGPVRASEDLKTLVLNGVDPQPALPRDVELATESICGRTTDYRDVESYPGNQGVSKDFVDQFEKFVVQLQWQSVSEISTRLPGFSPGNVAGVRWCSGALIAGNRVLTARHCLMPIDEPNGFKTPFELHANGELLAPAEKLATVMNVNFNYQVNAETGLVRTPRSFPVSALVEIGRDDGLDYAILEVGRDAAGQLPSPEFPAAQIATRAPRVGEVMALIQHPDGEPKKIVAGQITAFTSPWIFYGTVDSKSGSSGAPILDGDGRILGVHTNGGCRVAGGANAGVSTEAIAAESGIF